MRFLWAFLLFAGIGTAVYGNALDNSFHFDDRHYVVGNLYIRDLNQIPFFFITPAYSSYEKMFTGHYRPLVVGSYALNYAAGGLNPWGYHVVNLAFHIGSAFLVYLVVQALLRGSPAPGFRDFSAWAAGLIFLVHPFNSEVVNYITARSSGMCAFFYLLAFYFWVKYREEGRDGKTVFRPVFYLASFCSFILAMLSKEVAITLPAMIWLYDFAFRNEGSRFFMRWKNYLPHLFFVLMVAVPYLIFRKIHYGAFVTAGMPRDIGTNLLTEAHVLFLTWKYLLFPVGLTIDHDVEVIRNGWRWEVLTGVEVLLVFFLTAIFLWNRGRWGRVASFSIAWFFIADLPTTLVPLNAILQENRAYLSGVSFAVLAGLLIGTLSFRMPGLVGEVDSPMRDRRRWIPVAGLTVLLAVYAIATVQRNGVWQDERSLWSDAVSKAPFSVLSHTNLGAAYIEKGEFGKAEDELLTALRMRPYDRFIYYNLGRLYELQGRWQAAETSYRNALQRDGRYFDAWVRLAVVHEREGEIKKAIEALNAAIRSDPRFPSTHDALGVLYLKDGNREQAGEMFRKALSLDPQDEKARAALSAMEAMERK